MRSRKRNYKVITLGIVSIILTMPLITFSQYLNQIHETPLQFENTLTYNFDGEYLTSVNVLSDSNWLNYGWNILQFKQYDNEFNLINEKRIQDSLSVYQQGTSLLYFQNEYYFTGYQKDLYLQGNESAYIVKYDVNGDSIWFKKYFDSIPNARIVFLQEKDERLYIGGYFNYSPDAIQHSFVSEIDTEGNILWTKIFDDFNPVTIANLRPTSDGLLLSCRFGTGGTNRRVILYKLDFDGNIQWQKTYGLTGSWLGNNFAALELPNGQLLFYGAQSHLQTELSGSWLLLADAQGNVLKDTAYHFSVAPDYFHLHYSPPVIRENDFLILGFIRENGGDYTRKAFLACIDFDFNVKWKRTYEKRIIQNRLTFIHDLGNDFYLLSGLVDDDSNYPTKDEWFVVVDSMGCDVTNCYLGLEEDNKEAVGFRVYPNPTSGKTTFTIDFTPTNNSSIVITDLQGRKVKTLAITQKETQIDLDLVVDGIYLVHLFENGQIQATKKLIYAK